MIKLIKCIYCKKRKYEAKMGRVTCGKKECVDEHRKLYRRKYNKEECNRKKKIKYMVKYNKKVRDSRIK